MPVSAVLFDLDDTLLVDEAATRLALAETAKRATHFGAAEKEYLADAMQLADALWRSSEFYSFCDRIGINDAECLWGEFGQEGEWKALNKWAQTFRLDVFDQALRRQLIENAEAPQELASVFARTRIREMRLMPDALEVLARLQKKYRLGLLTNGAPALQQSKVDQAGLRNFFGTIMVSGEENVGKPEPEIFARLLRQLDVPAAEAVMVGNSKTRDVAGALAAGLRSVWLQVPGAEEPADVEPDYTITSLSELPALLEEMDATTHSAQ
jgi:putative hydrolase of the HAD superfamily